MSTYDRSTGLVSSRRQGAGLALTGSLLIGAALAGAAMISTDPAAAKDASSAGAACPYSNLWMEVVRSDRELHIYDGDQRLETHPVAVGQPDHETPRGEYEFTMVTWNPDWIPPDSEWAEDNEPKEPGEEGNPMGRAKILWNAPYYTVHGTEEEHSLGQAASHGSIRVANPVVRELGELVMECGGASRSAAWYQETWESPTDMREVPVPDPIPFIVRE